MKDCYRSAETSEWSGSGSSRKQLNSQFVIYSYYLIIYTDPSAETQMVCGISGDQRTHWRYAIVAIKILRTLIQRDVPTSARLIRLLLEKTHDNHSSVVGGLRTSPQTMSLTYSPTTALCKLKVLLLACKLC